MSEGPLEGQVALVTAGSRGTGAAACRWLAEHGAAVVVNYRIHQEAVEETVSAIRGAGGRATLAQADVSDAVAVKAMVDHAERDQRPIDVLVNNALPGWKGEDIEDVPWETCQWYVDQVVRAVYNTVRAVVPRMRERRWGRIVNIGTTSMYELNERHPPYITAKGALHALTRGLTRDLGPFADLREHGEPWLGVPRRGRAATRFWAGSRDTISAWTEPNHSGNCRSDRIFG